ncbi:hypothetical protein G9A89_014946 [Geosiphon pyriformis]|nr:hypothetical protein G9A89_014946 [Geosiphon pyriformis]
MSSVEDSSESDTFEDAQESFYDSNGRPISFSYPSTTLSSTDGNHQEGFSLGRTESINGKPKNLKLPLVPEISVTDTSLEENLNNQAREISVDLNTPRVEKEILLLSQAKNHGHTIKQTNLGGEPEVTVYIKDLDTGKRFPVSDVEEELKKSKNVNIDPLSFQILKRTRTDSQMSSPILDDDATLKGSGNWDNLTKGIYNDNETEKYYSDGDQHKFRSEKENAKSHRQSKSFLLRLKKRASRHEKLDDDNDHNDDDDDGDNVVTGNTAPVFFESVGGYGQPQPQYIKVRTRNKSSKECNRLFLAQELSNPSSSMPQQFDDNGDENKSCAIWVMKFSKDGKFLASGGKDMVVRVWAVISSDEEREHFLEGSGISIYEGISGTKLRAPVFRDKPFYEYVGHTADILDLSWSKNNFLLSSSMDKTVRLWHITRKECLCCFQHSDFVTAIAFHPKDDRFFLSGSLDCKLRLWNIPEKRVAYWNEIGESQLITAVGFTADGKIAVAGSVNGLCLFFETDGLKYNTQIHVRSSRGRNSKGRKITGIEAMPGTPAGQNKLLITSNDSRIRLYNMRDKSLEYKYKGLENTSSQIRATFSDDGRYIICGSEDRNVYIWNTDQSNLNSLSNGPGTSWLKKDKPSFETFEAHSNVVTVAIFAPTRTRQLIAMTGDPIFAHSLNSGNATMPINQSYPDGNIIVAADYNGRIKIFRNDCSYYPQHDPDTISIRSTRSWNSSLGQLLTRNGKGILNRRRRKSDASSMYSGYAPSATSLEAPVHGSKPECVIGEEMRCQCGSTEFKAFFTPETTSTSNSRLVCAQCGNSDVIMN